MRLSLRVPCGVVLLLSSSAAAAETPKVRLVFQAGPGTATCIGQEELERRVESELERPVFSHGDDATSVWLRVRLLSVEGGGFRALVNTEPADGARDPSAATAPRELSTSGECRLLDDELALVVALLSDAEVTPEPAVAPPPPAPPEPQPPESPDPPPEPVSSAPKWEAARSAPWTFELDLGGVVGLGMLPRTAFGGELGFRGEPLLLPALRIRVLGLAAPPVDLGGGGEAHFRLAVAGLMLSPELLAGSGWRLRGALGADVGVVNARTEGLEGARAVTRLVSQVSGGVRGSVLLGADVSGVVGLGVALPFVSDRFTYTDEGGRTRELFTMKLLSFAGMLGVTYEL